MTSTLRSARLLLVAALCLIAPSTIAPAAAQRVAAGIVEALIGTAVVTRYETGAAGPLAIGAELFEGDRIRTDAGARLGSRCATARS